MIDDNKLLILSVQNIDEIIELDKTNVGIINIESEIEQGGINPDPKLMSLSKFETRKPIYVTMKRNYDSYILSEEDTRKIFHDLEIIKMSKVSGIKWSGLNPNGTFNIDILKQIIEQKGDLKLIINRGIDSSRDYEEALNDIAPYIDSIEYIATSGGAETAIDGAYNISMAAKKFPNKIIAGSRINVDNIAKILSIKNLGGIHVSSGIRINNNPNNKIVLEKIDRIIKSLEKYYI